MGLVPKEPEKQQMVNICVCTNIMKERMKSMQNKDNLSLVDFTFSKGIS